MTLLGIDIGTTHCKAGVFTLEGARVQVVMAPTPVSRMPDGSASIDPEALWTTTAGLIRAACERAGKVQAVGVTSTAESGLLVDRHSGVPRSPILPWYDTSAQAHADRIAAACDPVEFYILSGVQMSYKCSLAKIAWLRARQPGAERGAVWLSVSDYIVHRLTGSFATDYSLAGRTGCFDIRQKRWAEQWLAQWSLSAENFPPAADSGTPAGGSRPEHAPLGIPAGTPVAVGGHDHLCAAFTTGRGEVFDSMGTAEAMIGSYAERALTESDYRVGLSSGCHTIHGSSYWMGGLSSSGGAVDWARSLLHKGSALTEQNEPTGILFFPYLLGSGAPHADPTASGALIGLRAAHTRDDLLRAVLEGTAYELELIRRAGETLSAAPIACLTAAGGGARNPAWVQIKADVSGIPIRVPSEHELALLGAAAIAGIGCGVYADADQVWEAVQRLPHTTIEPDSARHRRYSALFDEYLELDASLRKLRAQRKETPT